MIYQELIKSLQQLTLPREFSYLPSSTSSEKNVYVLLSVSENEIKARRDGTDLSVSIAQIRTIIDNLSEFVPLDVEKTLGGSGNTRSIIESLICLLPQVFHTRINNRKHIIYIPNKFHELGNLSFISESDLNLIISEHKKLMRQQIEEEYKDYLTNIAISKRSGKRFTQSAISSYLLFTTAEKLFDYAPDKWKKIENIYDITSMDSISQIIKDLKSEPDFCQRNHEDNNGWRLGAINQYFDYLVYKNNSKKQNEDELTEPIIDENSEGKKFSIIYFSNSKLSTRYILSLLAKPFVILSGNSGTGKTRIALRFAKYLEKQTDTEITNTLLIPVGADWTDNTKILGYFNPLANDGKGEYVKSEILSFLELAKENPSIPFFLILDEMNLSHVERYFSDFLSAMESGEPILLYKKPEDCECVVPEKITLPENLFVTGTVNIDETTYMFSPKVLDRANVIEFKPEMNDVLNNLISDTSDDEQKTAEPGIAEGFMELANEIRSGQLPAEVSTPLSEMKSVLESVYQILEKSGFEFAYRTAKEIRLYAAASFETVEDKSQFNINSVIDQQIVQKILPKIHGNKKQIGNLLSELKDELEKYEGFELSLAKVSSMIDKLEKYQYASFI